MSETMPDLGDDTEVLLVADRLAVNEFQVFRLAYEAWYSRGTSEKFIEKHFVHYMFHGEVPFWVRHFTRATLSSNQILTAVGGPALPRDGGILRGIVNVIGLIASLGKRIRGAIQTDCSFEA